MNFDELIDETRKVNEQPGTQRPPSPHPRHPDEQDPYGGKESPEERERSMSPPEEDPIDLIVSFVVKEKESGRRIDMETINQIIDVNKVDVVDAVVARLEAKGIEVEERKDKP